MYTVEVWRQDRRTRTGLRLVLKEDYATDDLRMLSQSVRETWPQPQFQFLIHQTWVTRRNAMTGELYQERYDTPRSCSPSSETYWTA